MQHYIGKFNVLEIVEFYYRIYRVDAGILPAQ
jgi:hypothetical protein